MDSIKKDHLLLANKYGVLPDPNFSAAKNKKIIAETIVKSQKNHQEKMRIWGENLRYRSEAIASFLKHVDKGKDNDVVRYFGRQELARLRGEDIASQLKSSMFKDGSS